MSFQNKRHKEIVDNLTKEENEKLLKISKELGRKIGWFFAGPGPSRQDVHYG